MAKMSILLHSRRRFLTGMTTSLAALPFVSLLRQRRAHSQELPKLEESDPTAQALNYVHDASQSDTAPADQLCSNCQHYSGADGEEWGPCALFPGKAVSANGWCAGWLQKSS
jgi:hypothetical protein